MTIFRNTPPLVFILFMLFTLNACSNTAETATKQAKAKVAQEVQLGTVMDVKYIKVNKPAYERTGSVGVTIGSGGHSGVYGSMDVSRMFDVFGNKTQERNTSAQEQTITIKRNNGEVVAITQPITEHFNRGDKVKITKVNGQARVRH